MHSPTSELLLTIVEIFFLAELVALHLALFLVFVFWLAKHVIRELFGLRSVLREWKAHEERKAPTEVIPTPSP